MSVILNYDFQVGPDDYDSFEYEADVDDYIENHCSKDRLLELAIMYWNDEFTIKERTEYIEVYGTDDFTEDMIPDILSEADDDWLKKQLEDEMHDAYEDEAREEFDDAEAYRKDPYGYNGVSPRDFY